MADSFSRLKAAFVEVQALRGPDRAEWLDALGARDPRLHAAVRSFLAFEVPHDAEVRVQEPFVDEPSPGPLAASCYADLGLLGIGGIGEVRRVHDPELARTVALKFLRTVHHLDPDPERRATATARFVAEAQIQASLQHPGIVPVYERGTLPDGRPYLTMSEVHGQTVQVALEALHEQTSPRAWGPTDDGWSLRGLVDALERACRAVAHAHGRGVQHRDLKPANLMLGPGGEAWVLDWGLARTTSEGGLAGTPAYLAPELLQGAAPSPAADVYALGAVLYAVLSGRDPYRGSGPLDTLEQVRRGPPPLAVGRSDGPPAPQPLVRLCQHAMARDPADRPASADRVADALRAWLDGEAARSEAAAFVRRADALKAKRRSVLAECEALEAEAEAELNALAPGESEEIKAPSWAKADRAADLRQTAEVLTVRRLQVLGAALERAPDTIGAHDRLADHFAARHREAEAARDRPAVTRAEAQLREADRSGRYTAYLRGEGRLTLVTDPPAEVLLHRFETVNRRRVARFERSLGTTPIREVRLDMGSYLCILRAEGHHDARYPVHIGRQAYWDGRPPGATEPCPVPLLRTGTLGPDEVYVPPGWFASGGDPDAMLGLPARRLWIDGFVIQRFPLITEAYLAFLDDLRATGRDEEVNARAPAGSRVLGGLQFDATTHSLVMQGPDGRYVPRPDPEHGRELRLRHPVVMLDWQSVMAYAQWLSARTGQAWRPPHELEWDKAARGVDGRWFPWGDHQEPSWSRMRFSARGEGDAFWSDVFDSYPVDESVYGARHMAGNARTWCFQDEGVEGVVPPPDPARGLRDAERRVARGGSWGSRPWEIRSASRAPLADDDRNPFVGIRLVRRLEAT